MIRETHASRRIDRLRVTVIVSVVVLACLRLCHVHLLWADEDYHLAAALNILHGKLPYRDFWYDKPPLNAIYYLLVGGYAGWPLRILDSLYVVSLCFGVFSITRSWWGEREALTAAALLAFYLTFYLPSAVIAFAADALMMAPHLAAIYCVLNKRPFLAGLSCAVAFLFNPKALFVLAVCGLWSYAGLPSLALGFALPVIAAALLAVAAEAWQGYYEQVWRWGWIYASGSPVAHPLATGLLRTLDWLGFHAALVIGAAFCLWRSAFSDRVKLFLWMALSFAAVCLGTRFAPHYYLQLLPSLVVATARGVVLAAQYAKRALVVLALALLVPFARFGPRYLSLAYDALIGQRPKWTDATMDLDSQDAARFILRQAHPQDTLLVWGYRPDLYVYTRLSSDSRFWDSQPLTGVPADRHLHAKDAIYSGAAARNRAELIRSHPTWIVDGLGPLNAHLAITVFPDLSPWLTHYTIAGETGLCVIYHRVE